MKKYLFFDTETSGLPGNWRAPLTDLDNWPRMVQVAWILADANGNQLETEDFIIAPENYRIPAEASRIHGITTEHALAEGYVLNEVLLWMEERIKEADLIVAHNIRFDEKILGAEFLRKGIRSQLDRTPKLCTMQSSTDYCQLPGRRGYKWPRLDELHEILFDEGFDGAHNALADIEATERCFWELRRLNLI